MDKSGPSHTAHSLTAAPLVALVVAAGRGTRAGGGLPKQYRSLGGVPVLRRAVRALWDAADFAQTIVVIHPDDEALAREALGADAALLTFALGGATRSASVQAGLAAVSDKTAHVLIHDAARPFVAARIVQDVIAALREPGCFAAAPALPMTDALWRAGEGHVSQIQSRDGLFRAQTPQAFHYSTISQAYAAAGEDAADDVAIALAHGVKIKVVAGDEQNFKLTTAADFIRAGHVIGANGAMDIRIGNGFDVHAFCAGDHVILCGVKIPHDRALKGHSDADVGLHTVTDAIYGALAEGDIGTHFPPSDPQWKGAPSDIFLIHAVKLAASRGYGISNVDLTFMCEAPKIGPVSAAMRARLAELLSIDQDRVSVKATTTEKLGFTGRKEGIAAMATVTLVKP